jgi:hypothetical protein
LADNIQESFGLTPIEAMAAGLPCVVTDWDGYRDTVRDGIDGFRVATFTPPPGFATDLIIDHALDLHPYGAFIGKAGGVTVVDCEATTAAFQRLAADPDLRRRLGSNGAKRARASFDWSVIIRAYEALWDELAEIRAAAQVEHPRPAERVRWPEHLDPFELFADYPTAIVQGKTKIRLTPDADTEAFEERLSLQMAVVDLVGAKPLPALRQLRDRLRAGPRELESIVGSFRKEDRVRALRGLMLMAKFGLVAIEGDEARAE